MEQPTQYSISNAVTVAMIRPRRPMTFRLTPIEQSEARAWLTLHPQAVGAIGHDDLATEAGRMLRANVSLFGRRAVYLSGGDELLVVRSSGDGVEFWRLVAEEGAGDDSV